MVAVRYWCSLVMAANQPIKNTQGTTYLLPGTFDSLFRGIDVHQGEAVAGSSRKQPSYVPVSRLTESASFRLWEPGGMRRQPHWASEGTVTLLWASLPSTTCLCFHRGRRLGGDCEGKRDLLRKGTDLMISLMIFLALVNPVVITRDR